MQSHGGFDIKYHAGVPKEDHWINMIQPYSSGFSLQTTRLQVLQVGM